MCMQAGKRSKKGRADTRLKKRATRFSINTELDLHLDPRFRDGRHGAVRAIEWRARARRRPQRCGDGGGACGATDRSQTYFQNIFPF